MNRCLTDSLIRHYYCKGMHQASVSGNLDDLHTTLTSAAVNYGIDFKKDGDDFVMASLMVNKPTAKVPEYTISETIV